MSYSNLVSYIRISPNSTCPRQGEITDLAIHHMACDLTVEACGRGFSNPARQASSNYGIGSDGRIGCYVEEENRSWCTSNADLDHRAITIEVANCGGDPDWPVSSAAWAALLDLCTDLCRRHGIRLNYTGDKTGNLHMHCWYAPTGCPGPYLKARFPALAAEVNRRLEGEKPVFYRVQVGAFNEIENAQRMKEQLVRQGYTDAFLVEVKA